MNLKNLKKKVFTPKRARRMMTAYTVMTTLAISMNTAMAAAPSGVSTSKFNKIIKIVFWIAECAVVAIGAIPSVIHLVQGQTSEDPRTRNSGIAGLVVTACVVGAIAAIKKVFF